MATSTQVQPGDVKGSDVSNIRMSLKQNATRDQSALAQTRWSGWRAANRWSCVMMLRLLKSVDRMMSAR